MRERGGERVVHIYLCTCARRGKRERKCAYELLASVHEKRGERVREMNCIVLCNVGGEREGGRAGGGIEVGDWR